MVIGAIVQRTVDLGKRAGVARAFDEIVPRLIAEATGPRFLVAAELLTARRVDFGSPGLGRANSEGAGVAQARPAHALTALVPRHQQVVAVSGCQFLAAQPFRRNNRLGIAEFSPPYRADVRIACIGNVVIRARNFKPIEVGAGQEIGDTGHGIRAVDGRGAFFEHLDAVDGNRGNGIDIDKAPADQARRHIHLTQPIDQHQRPRCPQTAQVDIGHTFRHGGGLVGIVPTVPLADHAVARADVLEEIGGLRRPLFLHFVSAHHGDRIGQTDGRFLKCRAGHHHFVEKERGRRQLQCDRRRLLGGHGYGLCNARIADQIRLERVRAGRYILDVKPAFLV